MEEGEVDRHPTVVEIVEKIKTEGIFDALRKECLADADTKPAYQNLQQKVETHCARFLSKITWSDKLNKNQIRELLRTHLMESEMMQTGVRRIVNQVINPKIDQAFRSKVSLVVCDFLGIDSQLLSSEARTQEFNEQHVSYGTLPNALSAPISLFPFNPLEPPPPFFAPPPMPGFEENPPPPAPPPLPPNVGNDDMEISSSGSEEANQVKPEGAVDDMDCTVTSEEEEEEDNNGDEDAAGDEADLSKGLAGYFTDVIESSRSGADSNVPESSGSNSMAASSQDSRKACLPIASAEPIKDECLAEIKVPGDGKVSSKASGTSSDKKRSNRRRDVTTSIVPERRELRRQRTRNKKYLSEEFTSIFTERRELLNDCYGSVVEEEIITTDEMIHQMTVEEKPSNRPAQTPTPPVPSDTPAISQLDQQMNVTTTRTLRSRRLRTREATSKSADRDSSSDVNLNTFSVAPPEASGHVSSESSVLCNNNMDAIVSDRRTRASRTPSRGSASENNSCSRLRSDDNGSREEVETRNQTQKQSQCDESTKNKLKRKSSKSYVEFGEQEGHKAERDRHHAVLAQSDYPEHSLPNQPELLHSDLVEPTSSDHMEQVPLEHEERVFFDNNSEQVLCESSEQALRQDLEQLKSELEQQELCEDSECVPSDRVEQVLSDGADIEASDAHFVTLDEFRSDTPLLLEVSQDEMSRDENTRVRLDRDLADAPEPDLSERDLDTYQPVELSDTEHCTQGSPERQYLSPVNPRTYNTDHEAEDDSGELERLAQRKLEILRAIELPVDRHLSTDSEEEEGELANSSDEDVLSRSRSKRKSKSKHSKKKKKKRSRSHKEEGEPSSKRSRHHK